MRLWATTWALLVGALGLFAPAPARASEPARAITPATPATPRPEPVIQPWIKYTGYLEYYEENYNQFESDHGFVALVNRAELGTSVREPKVTYTTSVRLDSQNVIFPGGRDCGAEACTPVQNDVRLERTVFRVDTRPFSGTIGDYNVNFSRGLALSVRKIDLIGVDAAIKGGRVDLRTKPIRVTGIAGFANRQNSDFATRQLIADPGYSAKSYTFAQDVENGFCDVEGNVGGEFGNPFWTVCSDLVAGGRVDGKLPGKVDVGTNYVYLDFGDELTAGQDEYLHMIGGDVGRAKIAKVWDFYVGANGVLRNPNLRGTPLKEGSPDGYGIYGSNTLLFGPTTVLLEAKHYREYMIAVAQNSLLQYSEAPTLEREDQIVPGNLNSTGGRLRIDHKLRKHGLTIFGNSMNYVFTKNIGDDQLSDKGIIATHNYAGVIWRKPKTDFVMQLSGGYRYEKWLVEFDRLVKRRFPHFEWSFKVPIAHTGNLHHSLEFRGEARYERRQDPVRFDFFRGFAIFGYGLAPHFVISFIGGIDTMLPTQPGQVSLTGDDCVPGAGSICRPHFWPGAVARINFLQSSFVRIFGGRQMGGLICVNGACRNLPDFEGARIEFVLLF